MPIIKYSKEIKQEIVNKYNKGIKANDLVTEYNLDSGVQLVYLWNKQFSSLNYNNSSKYCKELNIMSKKLKQEFKDKNINKLEEQIRILTKQLKEKDELVLLANAKYEILEKSIPSCTTAIILNMMKMSKKELIKITKTKIYKHFAFCTIYRFEAEYGIGTNKMVKYFSVSKPGYKKFKEKFNLFSPIKIRLNNEIIPTLPNYERKLVREAIEYVKAYFLEFNGFPSGAAIINKWILLKYKINISVKEIRKIQRENSFKLPTYTRSTTANVGKNRSKAYVKEDLIGNNFQKENVIGVDGSHMKVNIAGKWEKTVAIFSYDWNNKIIPAYSFDNTENSYNVYVVFKELMDYIKIKKYLNAIIQTDQGTAFANKLIFNFMEKIKKLILHSMSNAGFKHNAPTESLNGWVKEKFYKQNGYYFSSWDEFHEKFREFVNMWNLNHEFKYNINRKNQLAINANW